MSQDEEPPRQVRARAPAAVAGALEEDLAEAYREIGLTVADADALRSLRWAQWVEDGGACHRGCGDGADG